jgi:type I site-specific restriction endonuclease
LPQARWNDLEKVKSEVGLGLFVRSMVGLDREAAKQAFAGFHKQKAFFKGAAPAVRAARLPTAVRK